MDVQLACQLSTGVKLPVRLSHGSYVPLRIMPYRTPNPNPASRQRMDPRGRVDSHAPLRSPQSEDGGRVVGGGVVGVVVVVVVVVVGAGTSATISNEPL